MRSPFLAVALAAVLAAPVAEAVETIDFEAFADFTVLNTQIAQMTFSHAIVLGAGLSLNEFNFPPHSGSNVASDDGSALEIVFAAPVSSFSAYFTYISKLTLTAFDEHGALATSASSLFDNNGALSGVAGSSPNERIALDFAGGISRVVIAGLADGASFAMDDMSVTLAPVPEPASAALLLVGLGALSLVGRLRRHLP